MNSKRLSKMPLRMCSSSHYMWSLSNQLGKGATGAVYRGIHKVTGENVAVKTFNHMNHLRAPDVQMREFDVLKKVNHINIVRLLAVELEQGTDNKVLVMELCTAGSLYMILDDPENTFGISEEEFLLVLEHVTAGMKHLRDNNIVHRDLKPGNIMKFIDIDGSTIYKLTDFGAARELPDDQQFVSLYGTEEYLHPDMYERAVLRKAATKSFGATVDLWSIGVTLYHVATGFLPFRPYGGRKNKETMYQIITRKDSGMISGVQKEEGGKIEYSRTLPETCRLSVGFQNLVSPLLAALMESDPSKIWSFDQYFNSVTDILNHRLIHVFHVGRSRVIHLFIEPPNTFRYFQNLVRDQTDVKPEHQLFIYRSKQLIASTFEAMLGSKLETTEVKPVFLFSTCDNSVMIDKSVKAIKPPSFPSNNAYEQDASVAKLYCSHAYWVKRSIYRLANSLNLYNAAVYSMTELLQNRMCEAEIALNTADAFVERDAMAMKIFSNSYRFLASTLDIVLSDSQSSDGTSKQVRDSVVTKEESMQSVQHQMADVSRRLRPLIARTIHEHVLWDAWMSKSQSLPSLENQPTLASSYVKQIRDGWDFMNRNRNIRAISYHHEQIHNLEKKKLQDYSQKLIELNAQVVVLSQSVAEALVSWLGPAQKDFKEMEFLCEGLSSFQNMLRVHKESLDQTAKTYEQELTKHLININELFVSKKKSESASSTNSSDLSAEQLLSRRKTTESLGLKLRELSNEQIELKDEMQQNKMLVKQIRELLLPILESNVYLDRSEYRNS